MANFQRLNLLGGGMFTSTYAVKRLNDGGRFAVKFVDMGKLASDPFKLNIPEQLEVTTLFNQHHQKILSLGIQHVNVVQFIEIYHDHDLNQQGILMEKMDTSLKQYLHESITQQVLPVHFQTSLCHDIAQALKFLHQHEIVHGNLSNSNVLLTFTRSNPTLPVAKVCDYAMTEIRERLSLIHDVPSKPNDAFAYGVLMVEIITRQPLSSSNVYKALGILHRDHPSMTIVTECLKESQYRPSFDVIGAYMHTVNQTAIYTYQQMAQTPKVKISPQKPAPCPLKRSADAVIDDKRRIVYLRKGLEKNMYKVDLNNDYEWTPLPDCINLQCSLSFFNDELLTIGGTPEDESSRTADVHKLVNRQVFKQWDVLTRMPTARSRATSLACQFKEESILIVAGGEALTNDGTGKSQIETLNVVEVLTKQGWHTASPLPGTLDCSSGTICKGTVCLLGGWSKRNHELLSVFACSLQQLIESCHTQTLDYSVWLQVKIPNCPVARTTCITLQDKILLIGGTAPDDPLQTPTDAIHVFNEYTQSWDFIARLPAPRYLCYAVSVPSPSNNTLLVIGGHKDTSSFSKDVQIIELN